MGDKLITFAGRIGAQRHLVAVRDSFATLIPLIFAGSLSVLLNNIYVLFGMKENFLPPLIITFNGNVYWGTFAMLNLLLVIMIGYNLGKSYDVNPIITALVSFSSFIAIAPQVFGVQDPDMPGRIITGWGAVANTYTSASAMFVGILVAILAAEFFVRLTRNKKLVLNMPEGVPPAVARSFAALLPVVITVYAVVIIIASIEAIYNAAFKPEVAQTIFDIINTVVATPVRGVADTLPAALMVAFFSHIMWVFSLHGPNILEGVIQPVFLPLLEANIAAYSAGEPIPYVVTKQMFDIYVYMGGSGMTLGLLIAIFISSKNKAKRSMAQLCIGPGIFNINEPVIFGLPIVFNPILAIPFVLVPLITTVTTYLALSMNLAGRTIAFIPWSTPPILSAIMGTDKPLPSIILQIINLAIGIVIYLPFIRMSDRAEEREAQKTNS